MNKKIWKLAGIAAALLTAGTFLLASVSAPLQAEALVMEAGDAVVTYTGQGTVVYETELEITASVPGEVARVLVKEGQAVSRGDVIAELSVPDVEYQIRRLEADIKGYQAQIANLSLTEQKERDVLEGTRGELAGRLVTLEAERLGNETADSTLEARIRLQENVIEQEHANLRIARKELQNYRKDYGSDTSDPEYNQMRTAVNNGEKSLYTAQQALLELQPGRVEEEYYLGQQESLQAQIDSIEGRLGKSYTAGMQAYYNAQIEVARLSIEELGERQGKALITAPYDGVVSVLELSEGMRVEQNGPVATIGRNPLLEVLVPVREMDGIAPGDKVSLTLSKRAADETMPGSVIEIASQAQVQLSPLGVEESKIRVLVAAQEAMAVGSQADVEFTVYRREACLTVPRKAIFELDGQESVWVIEDGQARIQPVETGAEVKGGSIVEQGLRAGDMVIADANLQGLAQGKQVAQSA